MMSFPELVLRNQNCDHDLITKLILCYWLSTDKQGVAQFVVNQVLCPGPKYNVHPGGAAFFIQYVEFKEYF